MYSDDNNPSARSWISLEQGELLNRRRPIPRALISRHRGWLHCGELAARDAPAYAITTAVRRNKCDIIKVS